MATETTYEMVLKLIRAHPETGICTRHIWNLVGRDRRDPAVLKHLAKNVHIYASKSYNKRAGTRWYPVTTNTSPCEVAS